MSSKIFIGKVTFEASDSSLERYWLGDQKLSLEPQKSMV